MNGKHFSGLWIFLFFLSFFVLISSGRFGGDGLENYLTAESIVLDRDFSIHDRPFGVEEMKYAVRGRTGTGGKVYSQYGLGVAFLLVPFYLAGHLVAGLVSGIPHDYVTQFAVSLFNPVILALVSVFLFNLLFRLGYSAETSFATTLVYSICTMNVVYARSGFSEPVIALLVLLAAFSLLNYSKERNTSWVLAAAFSIGYAVFIKKNSFILFPGIALYFFYLVVRARDAAFKTKLAYLGLFAVPVVLSIAAILWQNSCLYGGALNTEHGSLSDMLAKVRTDGYPGKGLYYYLISSGKGYLFYNIALALGLFAIKDFWVRRKNYAVFLIILILSNLLVYSFIFVRGSLFSWGPRYLFPTLPLFAVFLAEFISKKDILRRKLTVTFFALGGFLVQLPNFVVSFPNYLFFVKEKMKLPEYLINFMPELSPIKGTWYLFISLVRRSLGGAPLDFSYNPDLWFFQTVSAPLKGYDAADIWFMNVVGVEPSLAVPIQAAIISLIAIMIISLFGIAVHMRRSR